ncbi:MAG: hypothetical protein RL719_487, partial [Actinomycetota bacterium]
SVKGYEKCGADRMVSFLFDPQVEAVAKSASPLVTLVQFDDVYCDASVCPPVIGHVVVYRDDNHLTNTFTRTLAPYLEPSIIAALKRG